MIVTISLGQHASAQGVLVSSSGQQAKIRIGTRILEGTLISDLAARRAGTPFPAAAEIEAAPA